MYRLNGYAVIYFDPIPTPSKEQPAVSFSVVVIVKAECLTPFTRPVAEYCDVSMKSIEEARARLLEQ